MTYIIVGTNNAGSRPQRVYWNQKHGWSEFRPSASRFADRPAHLPIGQDNVHVINLVIERSERIRTVRFKPYLKGKGPVFVLDLYDTGRIPSVGRCILAYKLREVGNRTPLFEGADFRPSPLHAIDSDDVVAALMGFLCLRPGDTDGEYFNKYTGPQLVFAETHAEVLWADVEHRFGNR